jgi:general secretion pathway protein B
MSFILDALKKSESDRQRQTGPALFEVTVAPPRTRLPPWAIAIAVLLVVNLAIVMWMVLRHAPAATATGGSAVTPAAAIAATPVVASPAAMSSAQGAPSSAVPAAGAPSAASPPAPTPSQPASAPPAVVAGAPNAAAPAAALTAGASAAGALAARSAANAPSAANGESNPDDYAPAEEAPPAAQGSSLAGHVRRGTAAGVPLYQDAAAVPGVQIPQLRLDLHVYAARPQDRFIMINMHKLREGDTLPEGVRVESITSEGAVLSYNGSRFLLPRE